MKRIVRKEEGLIFTCLLPEGRMENGAMDSRPGLIYFHGAQEEQRLPEKLLEAANTACVCISGEDWNRDLTPWPAEGVFKRGENFGGKADAYLALLTETIIPRTEEALALKIGRAHV